MTEQEERIARNILAMKQKKSMDPLMQQLADATHRLGTIVERPQGLAFKPERVFISPPPPDSPNWVINTGRMIARSLQTAAERLELAPNHRRALRAQADRMLANQPAPNRRLDRRLIDANGALTVADPKGGKP